MNNKIEAYHDTLLAHYNHSQSQLKTARSAYQSGMMDKHQWRLVETEHKAEMKAYWNAMEILVDTLK